MNVESAWGRGRRPPDAPGSATPGLAPGRLVDIVVERGGFPAAHRPDVHEGDVNRLTALGRSPEMSGHDEAITGVDPLIDLRAEVLEIFRNSGEHVLGHALRSGEAALRRPATPGLVPLDVRGHHLCDSRDITPMERRVSVLHVLDIILRHPAPPAAR